MICSSAICARYLGPGTGYCKPGEKSGALVTRPIAHSERYIDFASDALCSGEDRFEDHYGMLAVSETLNLISGSDSKP